MYYIARSELINMMQIRYVYLCNVSVLEKVDGKLNSLIMVKKISR